MSWPTVPELQAPQEPVDPVPAGLVRVDPVLEALALALVDLVLVPVDPALADPALADLALADLAQAEPC